MILDIMQQKALTERLDELENRIKELETKERSSVPRHELASKKLDVIKRGVSNLKEADIEEGEMAILVDEDQDVSGASYSNIVIRVNNKLRKVSIDPY